MYVFTGAAFDFRLFARRSERLGNAGSANQARSEIRHKSPPADPFSHKGLTDYATLFAALPKSVGNSGEQPPLRPRSKQRRNTSTLSLNGAERAARDLPPDASFAALSKPNAAAPKLAIHAYDGAIASHSLFARSGRHARLRSRSRPPPFKSINIGSIPLWGRFHQQGGRPACIQAGFRPHRATAPRDSARSILSLAMNRCISRSQAGGFPTFGFAILQSWSARFRAPTFSQTHLKSVAQSAHEGIGDPLAAIYT